MELTELLRGYTVELDLTKTQRTACLQHAGAARFAYNFGLARKIAAYRAALPVPSAIDLHRELNARKKTDLAWMYQISKCAPQEALRDLDNAYRHFFRRVKRKQARILKGKVGFPKPKKRSRAIGSFRLTGSIRITARHITLPRLGKLRLKEPGYLPIAGVQILNATVRERAGRWFVSVQVRESVLAPEDATGAPLGIDLGIKTLATCSDGRTLANPKALRSHLKRLRRLQRQLSRKRRSSKNRAKARRRLARQHYRVACLRKDALHKATNQLVAKTKPASDRPAVIVREDLNVTGMIKNHHLAQAITDVGFGEFVRQLDYKAAQAGITIQVADQWYPSSKRCSVCGWVKPTLTLAERSYVCESCDAIIDRDLNAARNLAALVNDPTGSFSESDACGDDVRPGMPGQLSLKQEPDTGYGMSING
jgi:putative transposase